jgi:hypothetical protein
MPPPAGSMDLSIQIFTLHLGDGKFSLAKGHVQHHVESSRSGLKSGYPFSSMLAGVWIYLSKAMAIPGYTQYQVCFGGIFVSLVIARLLPLVYSEGQCTHPFRNYENAK